MNDLSVNMFENQRGKITCKTKIVEDVKETLNARTGQISKTTFQYLEYECQLVKVAKSRHCNQVEKLVGKKRKRHDLRQNGSESDISDFKKAMVEKKVPPHKNFLETSHQHFAKIIFKSNLEQLKTLLAEVEASPMLFVDRSLGEDSTKAVP